MKKLILLLLLFMGLSSPGAWLYWQLDQSAGTGMENFDFDSALVSYSGDDGSSGYIEAVDASDAMGSGASSQYITTELDMSTFKTGVAYTFFIELANYDSATDTYIGKAISEGHLWDNVAANTAYIDTGTAVGVPVAIWNGTSFSIPEPTSALLVWLGVVGLALKRRQV